MQKKINQYIKTWEERCYVNGLPDEVPNEINHLVPTYKKIALAILKNDLSLLGFTPPKSEYYSQLKIIELTERANPKIIIKEKSSILTLFT